MARATDADTELAESFLYHIVCHDCPTESLSHRAREAERLVGEHRSTTGHDIELAVLSDGNDD